MSQRLGRVSKLLETGANDVLVVQPDDQSIDQRERLIPYVPDQFILRVDLGTREMQVDWDPEF
jgi:16S rRNA processing protein RimM